VKVRLFLWALPEIRSHPAILFEPVQHMAPKLMALQAGPMRVKASWFHRCKGFPQMSSLETQNRDVLETRLRLPVLQATLRKAEPSTDFNPEVQTSLEIRAFFERRAKHRRATGRLSLTIYCHTFAT